MKNENFLKAVGVCTVGMVVLAVAPVIGSALLAGTAAYLYSNAPRNKQNFVKLVGAVGCAAFAGPSVIGAAALVGFGAISYDLLKQKGQRQYGKPYESGLVTKAVESVKKTMKMGK